MFVIAVYDVNTAKNRKVLTFLRTHMNWVQNSVFEGELTKSELRTVKDELDSIVAAGDSVVIYTLGSTDYVQKDIIGTEKGDTGQIV